MGEENKVSKYLFLVSMVIFGTIGIFRRLLPIDSVMLVFLRGAGGALVLTLFLLICRRHPDFDGIRRNLAKLTVSGIFLGLNWIFLFESYTYTTVATATLCYYMSPVFLIIASVFFLHETMSLPKGFCVLLAIIGMVFVSGVPESGIPQAAELRGVVCGLAAAVFYTAMIMTSKMIHHIGAYDKTIVQLAVAAVALIPYLTVTQGWSSFQLTGLTLVLLAVVIIVHTGIACVIYFSTMESLKAQTIAVFSYVDPITAILLSALLLHEPMSLLNGIGAVMVLGAAVLCDKCS